MACLFCKNFQAIEPEEHKKQRETNQCQSYCGKDWNFHTAIVLYRDHPEYRAALKGWCCLYPQAIQRGAGHVCAQIQIPDYLHNHHWRIPRRDDSDHNHHSLFDWAGATLGALCHKSWEQRQHENLELKYQSLQRQLENVQRISASRLARLQKQPKQEKPKQEKPKQEEPKPLPESIVRLVAAE